MPAASVPGGPNRLGHPVPGGPTFFAKNEGGLLSGGLLFSPCSGRGTTSENTFVGAEIHSESCFSIETSLETMQKAQHFRLRRSKGQNTNKMY